MKIANVATANSGEPSGHPLSALEGWLKVGRGRKGINIYDPPKKKRRRRKKIRWVPPPPKRSSNRGAQKSKPSTKPVAAPDGGSVPAPEIDDKEYEVEDILEKRICCKTGEAWYLVKWAGFDDSENSWVKETDIRNCEDLIEKHDSKKKGDIRNCEDLIEKHDSKKKEDERKQSARVENDVEPKQTEADETELEPDEVGESAESGPQEEGKSSATEHITGPETDEEHILEIEQQVIWGPLFRSHLRNDEVPLCVLGSTKDKGELLHLVRLKSNSGDDGEVEIGASAAVNPYDGISRGNVRIVLNDYLKHNFPQLLIHYYESNRVGLADPSKVDVQQDQARYPIGVLDQELDEADDEDEAPVVAVEVKDGESGSKLDYGRTSSTTSSRY